MKFLSIFILSASLLSTGCLIAQQTQKGACACRDCKCHTETTCGCYSDKGCNCGIGGQNGCSSGKWTAK